MKSILALLASAYILVGTMDYQDDADRFTKLGTVTSCTGNYKYRIVDPILEAIN